MQNTQNKNNIIVFLGVLLFACGFYFLTNNYLNEKVDNAYAYMNNMLLEQIELNNSLEEVDTQEESTSSFEEVKEEPKTPKEEYVDPYQKYYIGSIEIPKINLNKGFTDVNSKYNTVNKNVEVVKGSSYPDVATGNFILAAHSGTSYLAYFKNLYKLQIGDLAYIHYNNQKYTYKIVNIYQQEKTGRIAIYRDMTKTCLTLVTCTKNSKTQQTVYILELQTIE